MKSLLQLYIDRVFDSLSDNDIAIIRRNLDMLKYGKVAETLITNKYRYVWINVDKFFAYLKKNNKDISKDMLRLVKIKDIVDTDIDHSICLKLYIASDGDLAFDIDYTVEHIMYVSADDIDYYVKNGYWNYGPRLERSNRFNIPMRSERASSICFNIESLSAKEFILDVVEDYKPIKSSKKDEDIF